MLSKGKTASFQLDVLDTRSSTRRCKPQKKSVLTKTTTEVNPPTARFMIRSCQEDSWRISQKSSPLHLLLTFVHIISFQQFHFTQQTLTLSKTKRSGLESPPTRAEVSPNKGLLSRPLVPYVLVVKSSMAGFSRRVPASRLLGSQQLLLLETPGPGRMLASF